ncbi:MAG: hypothetical protein NVS3B12_25660 [Acidimicrobiales bacterium]
MPDDGSRLRLVGDLAPAVSGGDRAAIGCGRTASLARPVSPSAAPRLRPHQQEDPKFSLMVVGLASALPHTLYFVLNAIAVPADPATRISHLPPVGTLFAAFLGYNPMRTLLGPRVLAPLTPAQAVNLTGKRFFPALISHPFIHGLRIVFTVSLIMCLIAAWTSWMRGAKPTDIAEQEHVGPYGVPLEDHPAPDESPEPEEWIPA